MWLLLQALVGPGVANAFGAVVGIAALSGLAIIANWVAFGPGSRHGCGGGLSFAGLSLWTGAAELECRAAFGYGATLIDVLVLKGLFAGAAKRQPASHALRALDKLSNWAIGAVLLPLILLVVPLGGVKKGGAWLGRKVRAGSGDIPPGH